MKQKQNRRIFIILLILTVIGFLGLSHPVTEFRNVLFLLLSIIGVSGILLQYMVNFNVLNKKYNLWVVFTVFMLVFGFYAVNPEFRSQYESLSTQLLLLTAFGFSGFLIHFYHYLKNIAL